MSWKYHNCYQGLLSITLAFKVSSPLLACLFAPPFFLLALLLLIAEQNRLPALLTPSGHLSSLPLSISLAGIQSGPPCAPAFLGHRNRPSARPDGIRPQTPQGCLLILIQNSRDREGHKNSQDFLSGMYSIYLFWFHLKPVSPSKTCQAQGYPQ